MKSIRDYINFINEANAAAAPNANPTDWEGSDVPNGTTTGGTTTTGGGSTTIKGPPELTGQAAAPAAGSFDSFGSPVPAGSPAATTAGATNPAPTQAAPATAAATPPAQSGQAAAPATPATPAPAAAPATPGEWKPTPEQEKWLGGANRQDPFIMARMPGPKPPASYFKAPDDQEIVKQRFAKVFVDTPAAAPAPAPAPAAAPAQASPEAEKAAASAQSQRDDDAAVDAAASTAQATPVAPQTQVQATALPPAQSGQAAAPAAKVPPQPTLNGKPSTGPKGQAWLAKYGQTHNPDGTPKAQQTAAEKQASADLTAAGLEEGKGYDELQRIMSIVSYR